MDMGVNQARHDRLALEVDGHLGRDLGGALRDLPDDSILDDDRAVGIDRPAVDIDHVGVDQFRQHQAEIQVS